MICGERERQLLVLGSADRDVAGRRGRREGEGGEEGGRREEEGREVREEGGGSGRLEAED